ncbi:HalOD1 output domain-containing protein [Halosimplex aquaticum]|uniref:HalOD1 output domain-containing protein n=1 Tax=Halosimplex aquaticum TaxID=3026162 RepID=A0ABD5XZ13_9EURY|nr:HalOD1 output domain-containing protein [Halosimplex aquaticum]
MDHARQHHGRIADGGTELVIENETEESTTRTLLRSIAAIKGVDERDLDPLYESVDSVALENIIQHAEDRDNDVSVEFSVDGYAVEVRADDTIRLDEP